jgi:hypothetical protein
MPLRSRSCRFENSCARTFFVRLRFFAAVWLLVSLAAHSLDACASHFGFPETPAIAVSEKSDCTHADCVACPQSHDEHADICETVSETATRSAQSLKLEAPVAGAISWAIVPQIAAALKPPENIICSRDGPDDFSLLPSPTGSTCPGRAPPLSV